MVKNSWNKLTQSCSKLLEGKATFRVQQPFDGQLVFGDSEGLIESLHGAQSQHLVPAESIWPKTSRRKKR